jgi:hypothetical protein
MKKIIRLSIAMMVMALTQAYAQVPRTLNYQGFLTENEIPVTTPRNITLTLLHGSTIKHTETFTSQAVDKGLFTVTLGKVPGNELPNDFDTWKNELTVEVKVNNTPIGNPIPLTTVPYSFMASNVDNVHVQDLADGSLTGTKVSPAFGSQNITTTGTVTAASFSGNGTGLTSLAVESSEIDDGTIMNVDINASAAITDTKLATISTAGKVSGNAITTGTIGGSTAINTTGSIIANSFSGSGAGLTSLSVAGSEIDDGTIMNVDISATAAIADTKLATISTAGKVSGSAITTGTIGGNTVINTTGAVTAASFTGSGAGLTSLAVESAEIDDGAIMNVDINANAAIVDTKLATISTAGKVSGSAITSGTIGGTTVINTSGSVTANSFSGNGASLTSLTAANISGTLPNTVLDADVQDLATDGSLSGTRVNPDFGTQSVVTTGTLSGVDFNYSNSKTRNEIVNQAAFSVATSNAAVFTSRLLTSGIPYFVRVMGGTYGNASALNASVMLPEGATVTSVAATIYDGDATYNATVVLARSTWATLGTTTNMASIVSSGSAGNATLSTSSITNPVIDNLNFGYFIVFQTVEAGANLGLFNVRITYTVNKAD